MSNSTDQITLVLSRKDAKTLLLDLREMDRHFDLETFLEAEEHSIAKLIEQLSALIE
jgi:hypothetical protein